MESSGDGSGTSMRKRAPYGFEYARIAVRDAAASKQFYEYHVGLETVDESPERVTLRCGLKHHCVELIGEPSLGDAKVLAFGYSVESDDVLRDMRERVVDAGFEIVDLDERMRDLCTDGFGVRDPNGWIIELIHEFYEWAEPPLTEWRPSELVHPFVNTVKYDETRRLYMDALGWLPSDWIGKNTVFLRGENRYHHSMGLSPAPETKVAHICFMMKSFDHVMRGRARADYKGLALAFDLVNHSGSGSLAFYMDVPQHGPWIELCDGHRVIPVEQQETHRARRLFADPRNVDVWKAAADHPMRGTPAR